MQQRNIYFIKYKSKEKLRRMCLYMGEYSDSVVKTTMKPSKIGGGFMDQYNSSKMHL